MGELSFLLAGGGSAGHVNPLIATASELRRRYPDAKIAVLGTQSGLETTLVPEAGFPLHTIPRVRIPRRPSMELLSLPQRLRGALATTSALIRDIAPDVVVGFGGDISFPAYRAAFGAKIPVVIHEQNAKPGLANRYGARNAAVVAVTFSSTPLEARRGKRVVTGLPLRAAVAELAARRHEGEFAQARLAAAATLGLDPELPTLLVTGGSLGAVSLNLAVAGAAGELAGVQVLHLTGTGKAERVRELVESLGASNYQVREYLSEMQLAYAVADMALTRAGAGMVCELAGLGIPAVYVPLPIGNGEQRLNAADVVAAGGGLLLEDSELSPTWVTDQLLPMLRAPESLREMGERAAAAAPANGAGLLADEIEALA